MGNSKVWRLGFAAGGVCKAYLMAESTVCGWLERMGLPKQVCKAGAWVIRASLVAALIYASYWLAYAVLIFFMIRRRLENSFWEEASELEGFDSEALFPDPYSSRYMNDPAFHDD